VVLFSPTQDGNYVPTRGAIDQLARDTIGVAHVYYLSEPSDTFRLSDRVGKMMSVWSGALRTYWPGFSLTGSPFDHPILFRDRIGPWVVEWLRRQMITRAAGTWAVPAEVRELLVRRRQEVERDELKARLQAAQSDLAMFELYREEIERLSVERDLLAELLASSEAEATGYEKEIDRQADEIRQLRYRIRVGLSSPTESEDEITWPEPSTLVEAILQAAEAYPDTLVITDRALASCEQMNPADNAPARLWRIFQSMDDVCRRWRTDTLKMSIAMALQQLGFKMSLVSEVTKGRHPNAYYFTYKGRRVSVGPHVQISRGERVYWYQDDDDRQFVVNHVGEHLPDSTT
jgi:hypothetical protein